MSLKGPGIFLAQGLGKEGWGSLEECAKSAAALGYKGMQLPLWDKRAIDLEYAAVSPKYCEELQQICTDAGCPIVELANHCEWQLVRSCPTYTSLHSWVAPKELDTEHGKQEALAQWAQRRAMLSVDAAANFGFDRVGGFSGSSIFQFVYPWPQRPPGLVAAAFNALAAAWMPIFEHADMKGVDVCFELHPGEDLMDGDTFNLFLRYVKNHPRCNILLDLSHMVLAGMTNDNMRGFIRENAKRIKMFHVKDGEFNPRPGGGVYSSYNGWKDRQGRFRSLGDGHINYAEVFALLQDLDLDLWAILEWECCLKGWKQGVREGAQYIQSWMDAIPAPERSAVEPHDDGAFDDFAQANVNRALIAHILGIPEDEVNTVAA